MANRRLLAIGAGLAGGLEKATNNLVTIMEARNKVDQYKELIDLKKQAIKADVDMLPYKQREAEAQANAATKRAEYYDGTLKFKENEEKEKAERYGHFLGQLNKYKTQTGEYDVPEDLDVDWMKGTVKNRPTTQAITDVEGNVVGYRPKGAVFQPRQNTEDEGFLGTEPNTPVNDEILPEGISEEDITHTMNLHKLSREEVLKRIKK